MAKKEFLFNRNNVAYCTSCSNTFEANKNGVIKSSTDMNTFCFEIATENYNPEYPAVRVVKAIPNRKLKEKFIEKNFNVIVPVKANNDDIDLFLDRVGSFESSFKDAIRYSVKGVKKMRKGDIIKYRDKLGNFILEYGEKIDDKFESFKSDKNGPIESIEFKSRIKIIKEKDQDNKNKNLKRDSRGKPFSFTESPLNDIEEVLNEIISSEVNTICRSDRFKIVIKELKRGSLKAQNKDNGEFLVLTKARMLTI